MLIQSCSLQYCPPSGEGGAAPLDTAASVRSRQLVMELLLSFRISTRKQLAIEVAAVTDEATSSNPQQQFTVK